MDDVSEAVWYIEVLSGEGIPKSTGTGVAIQLKQKGEEPRTYLLTCGHVLRSVARLDAGISAIHGWPPTYGYNSASPAAKLEICEAIRPLSEYENTADDWVVLKIIGDSNLATAAPAMTNWGEAKEGEYSIRGYPGGRSGFSKNIVASSKFLRVPFKGSEPGVLCFEGDQSKEGESGAAVISDQGEFVGIHRGLKDKARTLYSVSAQHIQSVLRHTEYELILTNQPTLQGPRLPEAEINELTLRLLRCIDDLTSLVRISAPSTYPHSTKDMTLPFLARLSDEEGYSRIYTLIDRLLQDDRVSQEDKKQFREFREKNGPELPGDSPDERQDAKPRIVIKMTPVEPDSADTENSLYQYRIFFVDIPGATTSRDYVKTKQQFCKILVETLTDIRQLIDPAKVWVELFVPLELLDWYVEKQDIEISVFPYRPGVEFHFLLRVDRNRWGEANSPRRELAEACSLRDGVIQRELLEQIAEDDTESFYFIPLDGNLDVSTQARATYIQLGSRPNVLGVQWTSTPTPKLLEMAVSSGIPLVLWPRESPQDDTDDIEADVGKYISNKTWNAIPKEIRNLRSASVNVGDDDWHLGKVLAVVLDDPRDVIPGQLSSPH